MARTMASPSPVPGPVRPGFAAGEAVEDPCRQDGIDARSVVGDPDHAHALLGS